MMLRIMVLSLVLGLFACSDDSSAPDAAADGGTDLTLDGGQVGDGAADQALSDGAPDSSPADQGPDAPPADAGLTQCQGTPLTQPTTGVCAVTAGSGTAIVIRGNLLVRDKVLEGGEVLVDGDEIVCVSCDCSNYAIYATATRLECPKGVVSPGLINPHDHITYTQNRPKPSAVRYDHRHEWRKGLNGKPKVSYSSNWSSQGTKWGELRMILGGATSLFGSGGTDMLLRNLDKDTEGLDHPSAIYQTFPLGDSGGKLLETGCSYSNLPSESQVKNATAYVPHVAEGVIQAARNEFLCMSGAQAGAVDVTVPQSAFIHSVGLTATDALDMLVGGTEVVWSPRSNISLYGFTADVVMFDNMGVKVALGSDWTVSGSMNMLRELACAAYLNESHYGGHFSDRELWEMVTVNAAQALGFEDEIGQLRAGFKADIAIVDGSQREGHAAVVHGSVQDVALVMRGGDVLYGEAPLVSALSPTGCEALDVCGRAMKVCLEREVNMSLSELGAAVGSDSYALFFCGAPDDEPTCVPSRPGEYDGSITAQDSDGDGIDDATDLCPKVFDPVRPMDSGKQRDSDGDALGDACDPCPLDPFVTQCSVKPVPGDKDGDGVGDGSDNCPTIYNKAQADSDKDGIGDACDACPKPNPGGGACPFAVKELRDRSLGQRPGDGTKVQVQGVTVIGIRTTKAKNYGFYVREGTGPFEAIFVYTYSNIPVDGSGNPLKVGDVVTVEGVLTTFNDIDEIEDPLTVTVTGSAAADPVDVTTAELQPGSTTAEALESQLVRVKNVTVSAKVSGSDDFWVTDSGQTCTGSAPPCTLVEDFAYDGAVVNGEPASTEGQTFSAIVGVINAYKNEHKLDPLTAADLVTP